MSHIHGRKYRHIAEYQMKCNNGLNNFQNKRVTFPAQRN